MKSVKNEKLFRYFSTINSNPNNVGRKQFYEFQSNGLVPECPNLYFVSLKEGKEKFDYLCSEYRQMYKKGDWWGFLTLWRDWKGSRWVLPFLCKWHKCLPIWLTNEEILEEQII